MTKKIAGQIEEIGGHIEQFAEKDIRKKVMEGSDKVAASYNTKKVALWGKGAMDQLDSSIDSAKREQIVVNQRNGTLYKPNTLA